MLHLDLFSFPAKRVSSCFVGSSPVQSAWPPGFPKPLGGASGVHPQGEACASETGGMRPVQSRVLPKIVGLAGVQC